MMKLTCNSASPPIGGLAAAELTKENYPIIIEWGSENAMVLTEGAQPVVCSNNNILRAIAKIALKFHLYGNTPIEKTQVDHWLTYSSEFISNNGSDVEYLQKSLGPITYLVANRLTIADLALFSVIYVNWTAIQKFKDINHIQRWFNLIKSQACVDTILQLDNVKSAKVTEKRGAAVPFERKQEGKFVDLPGAEMGKVIVRFPPEASGYLHIGHAKAALLNQYYQQAFQGKLIMRFDDTNPAKETVEFENVILGDLKMLEIEPDMFTHTSQYFDLMLEYCEALLNQGKAYADDTNAAQMKIEREQKVESAHRNNSVEKNFEMWKEMLKGSERGQQCCIRAKIDMSSPNGCLRDPTIYRCKNEPHPRTETQYKVYPTYDFACPIVDAIENVTHTLRTMEYHDRDDQFYWFIDALKLRKPYIWEYSRLNMTNTVLSKRKLTWFVDEGLVDGWDDPRFPTVRGILRRGMTVKGLREFIIAQGSSKSVVFMEWDKIWAFNKKVIDPIAPRYTALNKNPVVVNVAGAKKEMIQVPAHPKNNDVGMKTVWLGPRILIDYVDAEILKEGEYTTFINWGNLMINKINKKDGKITLINATPNLENKDFKKTLKLTWLAEMEPEEFPPTYCVYFDHIISKAVLSKDEDFKDYIGHATRTEIEMLGDPELKKCKKGDIIQLTRRGFFKVDNAYASASEHTGVTSPIILFEIPDGHTKEKPTSGQPKKSASPAKEVSTTATSDLNDKIEKQGNLVRDLKAKKADKSEIDAAVKLLLGYKADFKKTTGQDWKPGATTATTSASAPAIIAPQTGGDQLSNEINKKGDIVRDLKAKKASKNEIDAAVKELLSLKADYKAATGQDWKPSTNTPTSAAKPASTATGVNPTIGDQITKQGDLVRDLKAKKADKSTIDTAVKALLTLKAYYKKETGQDWKPPPAPISNSTNSKTSGESSLNEAIAKQGNLVRDLKGKKASKPEVDAAVKRLLSLKSDYKSQTGKDWTPGSTPTVSVVTVAKNVVASNESDILQKINKQGDKIRDLKAQKADKNTVDGEVTVLLALKADYKLIAGKDWKPGTVSTSAPTNITETMPSDQPAAVDSKSALTEKITEQGNLIRNLKSSGAAADQIKAAVEILNSLKAEYKTVTGIDFPTAGRAPSKPKAEAKPKTEAKPKAEPKAKAAPKPAETKDESSGLKKITRLGLEVRKDENLSEWYSQVLTKSELIEYYDVSGCYILRPWAMAIWRAIHTYLHDEITRIGVKEVYFPMFVSKSALQKEKDHIADFSPEVAWVTRSGDSDLAEPIAIRPTSETIMYPSFAKWIQSYRDLPLRINQWSNVVRWEFKHPQPFLRTREFLWQEGHTAFADQKDAEAEVLEVLEIYAKVYEDLLAIPVRRGRKTEKEKFAGGFYTTTVEAFVSASGRSIQGATSHHLGQNFSKMFDIIYEDPVTQEKKYVYQNSWGMTTRTVGVMIMVHGDDKGLVLPPRVASVQAIVVPCGITVNSTEEERNTLQKNCNELEVTLKLAGIRAEGDYRDNYSPGWKFNHWELKGVPIRIELGPKDIKSNQLVIVRRDTGEKLTIPRADAATRINKVLESIQRDLFTKAQKDFENHLVITKDWDDFCANLEKKKVLLSPFCGGVECEGKVKDDSAVSDEGAEAGTLLMGAKSLCIPFKQPAEILPTDKCIYKTCTNKPQFYALFGRSY